MKKQYFTFIVLLYIFSACNGSNPIDIDDPVVPPIDDNRYLSLYAPSIEYRLIAPPEGLYRHVPSISLSYDNGLMGAYLRNQVSSTESVRGQTAVFIRSNDKGNTWSEPKDELNSTLYTENPLDPVVDNMLQGEIHIAFIQNKEYACIAHRGGPTGGNGTYLATRENGGKWKINRILFTTNFNTIQLSSVVVGKVPSTGYKATYTIDDEEYDVVLFKPMEDSSKRILIPAIFMTKYGGKHRIGTFVVNGSMVTLAGLVPLGKAVDASAWEPTLWQAKDGTYYIQCRNNANLGEPSFDNHLISSSKNLNDWTPMEFLSEDIHVNRQMRMKVRSDLWMGVGISHRSQRRSLVTYLSVDGIEWVHGARIGNEHLSNDWTHYSDIACDETNAYVLYSETVDKAQYDNHVNCIKFAKFPLPKARLIPVSGSPKAYYESVGKTGLPITSETHLTLVPGSSGSIALPRTAGTLSLFVKLTDAPKIEKDNPYILVAVGDAESGYFTIEYRMISGGIQLWAGNQFVENVGKYTEDKMISIDFNTVTNTVTAYEKSKVLGKYCRVYLGNYLFTLPKPIGNIVYNIKDSYWKE